MQKHRDNISSYVINAHLCPFVPELAVFGLSVIVSHENTRYTVHRDRCYRADRRDAKAEVHNIKNIFKRGKTQRNRDGINDRVKPEIEFRPVPCSLPKDQILHALFGYADDQEIHHALKQNRTLIPDQSCRDKVSGLFQKACRDRGKAAEQEQGKKKRERLLLNGIDLINIYDQQDGRQHADNQIEHLSPLSRANNRGQGSDNFTYAAAHL